MTTQTLNKPTTDPKPTQAGDQPAVVDAPGPDQELPPLKVGGHIPALDGIRGIAVLLVLFCHGTQKHGMDELMGSGLDRIILSLSRISWTGVDLFFVLSGFLITGILYDAKGKDHYFRNFYARRTVRIFPLYYTCLLLYLVIMPWAMGSDLFTRLFGELRTSQFWYWAYLSNYSQSVMEQLDKQTEHIIHVSWSLSIEEQFYLCWPLVCFLFTRKTLLKISVGMFFGSMLVRTVLLYFDKWSIAMGFTPCRVDGLAVGAFIALVARGPGGLRSLIRPAKYIGPAAAVAIAVLVVGMYKLGYRRGIGQSPGYVIMGTALFALLYGSLLTWAAVSLKGTWSNRFFSHPILRSFGKYSYAVYLLHLPVMVVVAEYVFHPSSLRVGGTYLPGLAVFWLITFTLSMAAALVSWNVLEKHCLKLKDYFPLEAKTEKA